MEIFIERELKSVKRVDDSKRYWFIRTFSGEAFDIYKEQSFVGLALNNVPLKYIQEASLENAYNYDRLRDFIQKNTEYKKSSATKWANQLIDFVQNVAVGDCVIIPSTNSENIAIGEITSDVYLEKNPKLIVHRNKEVFLPEKRRSVKWMDIRDKDSVVGDLRSLFSTHSGITNADNFGDSIEGLLNSIFIKDEQVHLVIKINQDEDINAFHFKRVLDGITYFYNEFGIENGGQFNEDLTLKIRMQSRGKMALKASIAAGLVGVAILIALSNNNEVELDVKNMKVKGKSGGFLNSVSDFLDRKQQRKKEWEIFKDSLEAVKAEREQRMNSSK